MADREPLTFIRSGWAPSMAAILGPACHGDLTAGRVASLLRRRQAHAWRARVGGVDWGALVACVEDHGDHRALYVVVQRFRPLSGVIWTNRVVADVLEPEARRLGCAAILAHVERPGMAHRLGGHGFRRVADNLYRKAL